MYTYLNILKSMVRTFSSGHTVHMGCVGSPRTKNVLKMWMRAIHSGPLPRTNRKAMPRSRVEMSRREACLTGLHAGVAVGATMAGSTSPSKAISTSTQGSTLGRGRPLTLRNDASACSLHSVPSAPCSDKRPLANIHEPPCQPSDPLSRAHLQFLHAFYSCSQGSEWTTPLCSPSSHASFGRVTTASVSSSRDWAVSIGWHVKQERTVSFA